MITKNLKYLRSKFRYSQQVLADTLSIPRTTLGDYERGKTEPNIEMLIKMAELFDITVDQLVRKDMSHEDLEILRNKDLRVLAISVDQSNRENIELVDRKAEAGYLESFQDPEYIKELPKLYFPVLPEGTYRAFEIQGDSMLPMEPGSIVICRYTESLQDIKPGHCYVVISRQDGLVYKRVTPNRKGNALILQSDNPTYAPYELEYDEVGEVWQYHAHVSFSDHQSLWNNTLDQRLDDIQKRVIDISSKLG